MAAADGTLPQPQWSSPSASTRGSGCSTPSHGWWASSAVLPPTCPRRCTTTPSCTDSSSGWKSSTRGCRVGLTECVGLARSHLGRHAAWATHAACSATQSVCTCHARVRRTSVRLEILSTGFEIE
eukprot:1761707-Prymnesium_polylepis.1